MFFNLLGRIVSWEAISIVVLLVLTVVATIILTKIIEIAKRAEKKIKNRQKQFKKYFGVSTDWRWFSKDTSHQSWRDKNSKRQLIIQTRIDVLLPILAKDFLDACEEEEELMKPYFEHSKGAPAKDLRKLGRIQRRISLAKNKFQNATKAAKEGGFKAEYKITEERKIEKEKQEGKVKS